MAHGLAYIGRVESVGPIDGADRIETADVDCGDGGRWRGVVAKGDFAEESPCVVYLQDAIVQPCHELSFLEKSQWRVKAYRVNGIEIRCVILPYDGGFPCGLDITEALGVTRYGQPEYLAV